MNSLRDIIESSPQMRRVALHSLQGEESPQPLGDALWDWAGVKRILVVRLRSIGDTVLSTPSLFALKRFVPNATVDVLVEDWVSPLLEGLRFVDNVITLERDNTWARVRVARILRERNYDVVYNLHGGSTAAFLTRATGAPHRVGYGSYRYASMHNHLAPPSATLWQRQKTHSVEQQLGLPGWTGVPVTDLPPTQLAVTESSASKITDRLREANLDTTPFVVIHPAAAFATKQWAAENFAAVVESLAAKGLEVISLTTPKENEIVDKLRKNSSAPLTSFSDLSLPEITALLSRARLFVGNDSGIAHMASAVATPSVVIFGSSNTAHWRPWATTAAEVVLEEMECQPCHGYYCEKFDEPECIKRVPVDRVLASVDRVLRESAT